MGDGFSLESNRGYKKKNYIYSNQVIIYKNGYTIFLFVKIK